MATKFKEPRRISVWGIQGASIKGAEFSVSPVRPRDDGDDTTVRAFGRRVARAIGGGAHCCGAREDHHERRNGAIESTVYELTFGHSCRTGGIDVCGRLWLRVYSNRQEKR